MSNRESRSALSKAKLIISINDSRSDGDPFKLTVAFRKELGDDTKEVDNADLKVGAERGDDATASPKIRAAKDELGRLLREGYRAIDGVPSYELSAPDKRQIFEIYGWRNGEIGILDDTRIQEMADDVVDISEQDPSPAWSYPAQLVTLIQAQIAIIDAQEGDASGGDEQSATGIRNMKLAKLRRTILRARFFYCYASDDADRTPELSKIGFQPRRLPVRKKAEAAASGATSTTAPK